MTDGRIPGKWMNDPQFIEMDVHAWCVFTKAIAWSNEAGTDGLIKHRYLGLLHPDGHQPQAYAAIADMGLWTPVAGGYQFLDWDKKAHEGGLGQSTSEAVQKGKDFEKERSRRRRAHGKGDHSLCAPDCGATTAVAHSGRRTGQDRTGTDTGKVSEEEFKNLNVETGEVTHSSSAGLGGEYEAAPESGEVDPGGGVTEDVTRDVLEVQTDSQTTSSYKEGSTDEFKNLNPDTGELPPAPSSEADGGEHHVEESSAPREVDPVLAFRRAVGM